jgi:neuralized-like protein 4
MWVDIRYVHLHEHTFLLPLGKMYVTEDQTRRLQDPLSESDTDESTPNKDIQFGYHSASGKHIRITNNGLGAERMNPEDEFCDGVAYGAQPLKGLAEFGVKMVSYVAKWSGSLQVGLMRCKKGKRIESGSSIPTDSYGAEYHCVWGEQRAFSGVLSNNLVTPGEESDYGYVNLDDLREGDCVGLCLSRDGVLEFTVNGESQGIAAKNIYTRDTDVYAVVDHFGCCVATVITKAGECYTSHVHAPMIANSLSNLQISSLLYGQINFVVQ